MSGRSVGEVWKALWQSLKQSTKNRGQLNEIFVGKDQYGNKYFERMAGDRSREQRIQRRVETLDGDRTVAPEMPVEWKTWLHGRRVNPPTEEEIAKNVAAMKDVLRRAEELEAEENKAMNRPSTKSTFKRAPASKYPIYADYDAEAADRKDDKTDASHRRD